MGSVLEAGSKSNFFNRGVVSNRCMVAANNPIKKLQFESESFLKKVASDVCGQAVRTALWSEEAQSVILSQI